MFYSFVLYIRLKQGFWPFYGAPDAGAFSGFEAVLDVVVGLLWIGTFFSPLFVVPILALIRYPSGSGRWRDLILFGLLWVVFVVILWSDPGRFLDWYMD